MTDTIEHSTHQGVIHIWPHSKLINPEAQPFSSERESDVWEELRNLTFNDDDVRGNIAVATHTAEQDDRDSFLNQLKKEDVVLRRVKFLASHEVELEIHHPATKAYSFQPLRNVAEEFVHGPNGWEEVPDTSAPIEVPAESAWTETRKESVPFHLGSKQDADGVIKQHRNKEVCALALWYPVESDHLKYLSKVQAAARLPIYIFHCDYHADKWGVERECRTQTTVKQTITIEWADTIKRESTQWLIPEFLPLREVTAFSGEMDTRKSTTVIDIAAKGSTGGGPDKRWFNNTPFEGQPFSTVYAGTEDSFSTVQNRFIAAGGNPKALGRLPLEVKREQPTPDGVEVVSITLSFDDHLNVLREAILEANKTALHPVGLLINDPLIAFFGDRNFNKAQDCQVILQGLKKLCEELKISIINLMHYNKTQGASAKEKTGGSQRLIEAHRQAWSFTLVDETDKESNTLIAPIKKNLLRVAQSYEITTVSTPIEWEDEGVNKR